MKPEPSLDEVKALMRRLGIVCLEVIFVDGRKMVFPLDPDWQRLVSRTMRINMLEWKR
jgi:hypothetical protein